MAGLRSVLDKDGDRVRGQTVLVPRVRMPGNWHAIFLYEFLAWVSDNGEPFWEARQLQIEDDMAAVKAAMDQQPGWSYDVHKWYHRYQKEDTVSKTHRSKKEVIDNDPAAVPEFALQEEEWEQQTPAEQDAELDAGDIWDAGGGDLPCFMCGEFYTPSREKYTAWGNSGKPFRPTDWLCPTCARALAEKDAKIHGPDLEMESEPAPTEEEKIEQAPVELPEKEEEDMSIIEILEQAYAKHSVVLLEYVNLQGGFSVRYIVPVAPITERLLCWDLGDKPGRDYRDDLTDAEQVKLRTMPLFVKSVTMAALRPDMPYDKFSHRFTGYGRVVRSTGERLDVLMTPAVADKQKTGKPQWVTETTAARMEGQDWVRVS